MKLKFDEYEGCFSIELEAESLADAAFLVRMGMNTTQEIRVCGTTVMQNGDFYGHLVLAKNRRADSAVPRRR